MAKRSYGEFSDNAKAEAQPSKRKAGEGKEKQLSGPGAAETITSARQLQHLLRHSSDPAHLQHGLSRGHPRASWRILNPNRYTIVERFPRAN